MKFCWFCFIFLCLPLYATTFQIQSIDKQLKEADGVFIGHFLKSKSVTLEDGKIATQMIFRLTREHGLQSDVFGIDELIVHYPGGKIGDQVVRVHGVPSFVSGEKVALLIKNVDNRYWGLNLGLGSFKVVNYGKDTMLINSLFPHDPQVGQMPLSNFEDSLKNIKKSGLKVVETYIEMENARSPASILGKNRSIASNSEELENKEPRPLWNSYWLVSILAILGGLFRVFRRKVTR